MFNPKVVIVGSGPAGSSVAISCAQLGLNVVLIENEEFPLTKPGETLHPGIEPLLKKLGVTNQILSANFLRHEGNWIQWEDTCRFESFGEEGGKLWKGFQVWRPKFDAILLNHAQELGVEVIQPCRALRPILEKNRIVGIETSKGSLKSDFVIDAAGSNHWLAKLLGLEIETHTPTLVARFGYVEGNCEIRNKAPLIVADNDGWTWTARVQPRVYQWTRLSFNNESMSEDWVPQEFQGLKKRGTTRGANVTWRVVSKPAGSGYFIVGDAAAVLDPASSHGVLKAIMSGMMTAHMISKSINDESLETVAILEYSRWVKEWFLQDVKRLKELYSIHPFPPKWININQIDSKNESPVLINNKVIS